MTVVRRRVFPETFKRDAVEKVANSGLSAGAIAAELGIHETVLRRWMNQFPAGHDTGMMGNRAVTAQSATQLAELTMEIADLRLENERLRAEREVLKKALAIVFAELK